MPSCRSVRCMERGDGFEPVLYQLAWIPPSDGLDETRTYTSARRGWGFGPDCPKALGGPDDPREASVITSRDRSWAASRAQQMPSGLVGPRHEHRFSGEPWTGVNALGRA